MGLSRVRPTRPTLVVDIHTATCTRKIQWLNIVCATGPPPCGSAQQLAQHLRPVSGANRLGLHCSDRATTTCCAASGSGVGAGLGGATWAIARSSRRGPREI